MGKRRAKKVKRKLKLPPLNVGLEAVEREERTVKLTFRFTPTERRQMRELAEHFGTTSTNVVSQLVAQAWHGLFGKGV